ncbi:hypothetical protein BJ508DRAFT_315329 [Ascobolus immersus RN42]|uniref:Uncharacterized protein n=1 Tax=Ascobolus immersus RN42 TaxID=1160509 RepID=A0A3N4HHF0_ASCIM|nr:hypothetical protein BJ508DRAFT_315329 [Ascobolus immersus RN42]
MALLEATLGPWIDLIQDMINLFIDFAVLWRQLLVWVLPDPLLPTSFLKQTTVTTRTTFTPGTSDHQLLPGTKYTLPTGSPEELLANESLLSFAGIKMSTSSTSNHVLSGFSNVATSSPPSSPPPSPPSSPPPYSQSLQSIVVDRANPAWWRVVIERGAPNRSLMSSRQFEVALEQWRQAEERYAEVAAEHTEEYCMEQFRHEGVSTFRHDTGIETMGNTFPFLPYAGMRCFITSRLSFVERPINIACDGYARTLLGDDETIDDNTLIERRRTLGWLTDNDTEFHCLFRTGHTVEARVVSVEGLNFQVEWWASLRCSSY